MSNQPKWAWWVVGIVIPVIGIIVSIQLATKSDSGGESRSTGTNDPAPAASGGGGTGAAPAASQAADAPAKVLFGPVKITLTPDTHRIDLDVASPIPQTAEKGSDAWIGFNLPDLTLNAPTDGDVMAIVSADGPAQTAASCREAIKKRGSHASPELTQGMGICLATDEGRTAYLKVTTVPSRKSVSFETTVWE